MARGSGWRSYVNYNEDQDKPQISLALLRRVLGYGRPYLGRIVTMLVTIALIASLGAVPPLLIRQVLDVALPNRDMNMLNWLALGMVTLPLLTGLLGVLQRYLSSAVGEGLIYDLRNALFRHLQSMSLRFFTTTQTGELMSRMNNDVVGSQRALTGTLIDILSNIVTLVITFIVMITLDWRLTLLSIAILPLFILPARRVATLLRGVVREQLSLNAQMNAMMNETLNVSGALLIKIFGRLGDEEKRFASRAVEVRDIGIRQTLIGRWFFLALSLASAVGTALVIWVGGMLVINQTAFTAGTLVAFTVYLGQLYGPITALTNARVELATSLVSFERVFEVLDLPIEIVQKTGAKVLGTVRGKVTLDKVYFDYNSLVAQGKAASLHPIERVGQAPLAALSLADRNGKGPNARGKAEAEADSERRSARSNESDPMTMGEALSAEQTATRNGYEEIEIPGERDPSRKDSDEPVPAPRYALTDVSFTVQPGQLAALVGPSGAGKTTLTYLLPRLYDPTSGRITVDDIDIRDVTLDSLAQQIGMVTQESYLFHDTIRANLLYARADATDAEMQEACKAANIHDFIMSLSDGYDTIVGERGYRLSGGEKQRISIARVLLKDPRILILDEATSALDSRSEALIQAALERLMVGRTSLVIAHRLSTVLAADVILVLDKGRLVEQGTHAELLAQEGLYATLYHTQFRDLTQEEDQQPAAGAANENIPVR